MSRYDTRLRRLEVGRICQTHRQTVFCIKCTYEWLGTDAEWAELQELYQLLPPMDWEAIPSYGSCRIHWDERLFCSSCARPYLATHDATKLIESGKGERYLELLALLRQEPTD
jgi:hypothetical protein